MLGCLFIFEENFQSAFRGPFYLKFARTANHPPCWSPRKPPPQASNLIRLRSLNCLSNTNNLYNSSLLSSTVRIITNLANSWAFFNLRNPLILAAFKLCLNCFWHNSHSHSLLSSNCTWFSHNLSPDSGGSLAVRSSLLSSPRSWYIPSLAAQELRHMRLVCFFGLFFSAFFVQRNDRGA